MNTKEMNDELIDLQKECYQTLMSASDTILGGAVYLYDMSIENKQKTNKEDLKNSITAFTKYRNDLLELKKMIKNTIV